MNKIIMPKGVYLRTEYHLIKITQRKEDCHYETTLWDKRYSGGWYPFLFGFGFTQEESDTNLLKQYGQKL